jgi:hypothetical protein
MPAHAGERFAGCWNMLYTCTAVTTHSHRWSCPTAEAGKALQIALAASSHLCRPQDACPDAWLHEQLLEHCIHVAGRAAILQSSILPRSSQRPRREAEPLQHLQANTGSVTSRHIRLTIHTSLAPLLMSWMVLCCMEYSTPLAPSNEVSTTKSPRATPAGTGTRCMRPCNDRLPPLLTAPATHCNRRYICTLAMDTGRGRLHPIPTCCW